MTLFHRRGLAALALTLALTGSAHAQQKVSIDFWHGLPQPLGGLLEQVVAGFNASQAQYEIKPSFRGSYPETMVSSIAAFRAGNAPHIVQMFEVGTATMMAARGAVKPVHELLAEAGVALDTNDYLPAIRGYYSTTDGKLMSMPFNSSTSIMFYNKEAFRKAGLDPEKAPATWAELRAAAKKIKESGASACAFTSSWPTWTQIEQVGAIHNVGVASKANGFGGPDATLDLTNPLFVRHLTTLVEMAKEGTYRYGGRDGAGDALFASGECAITHASSGARARYLKEVPGGIANIGFAFLPYYSEVTTTPNNTVIGGASFWVMNAGPNKVRAREELTGIAEFFKYISRVDIASKWHIDTGYLPITKSAFEAVKATGYYDKNPGADIPITELLRGTMTANSMGFRLGNFAEIRVAIQEEMERAIQGQQTPAAALEAANKRGNEILRAFERANRS